MAWIKDIDGKGLIQSFFEEEASKKSIGINNVGLFTTQILWRIFKILKGPLKNNRALQEYFEELFKQLWQCSDGFKNTLKDNPIFLITDQKKIGGFWRKIAETGNGKRIFTWFFAQLFRYLRNPIKVQLASILYARASP